MSPGAPDRLAYKASFRRSRRTQPSGRCRCPRRSLPTRAPPPASKSPDRRRAAWEGAARWAASRRARSARRFACRTGWRRRCRMACSGFPLAVLAVRPCSTRAASARACRAASARAGSLRARMRAERGSREESTHAGRVAEVVRNGLRRLRRKRRRGGWTGCGRGLGQRTRHRGRVARQRRGSRRRGRNVGWRRRRSGAVVRRRGGRHRRVRWRRGLRGRRQRRVLAFRPSHQPHRHTRVFVPRQRTRLNPRNELVDRDAAGCVGARDYFEVVASRRRLDQRMRGASQLGTNARCQRATPVDRTRGGFGVRAHQFLQERVVPRFGGRPGQIRRRRRWRRRKRQRRTGRRRVGERHRGGYDATASFAEALALTRIAACARFDFSSNRGC